MTDSSFIEIAHALDAWPELPPLSGVLPAPYQRLLDAVCLSAARPGSVGERDLVALVRQVLRNETRLRAWTSTCSFRAAPDGPRSSIGKMLTARRCQRKQESSS